MDAEEGESNWAHACRVLGLDWPSEVSKHANVSSAGALSAGDIDASRDAPGAVVVVGQSRPRSTHDA
jgi:hypothetical protein